MKNNIFPKVPGEQMSGRVSVIIPTYNYGHYISDALDSILDQDFPDIEIIVIDDGSKDNTKNILNGYKHAVKYIYQENSGLSAARNIGIENSTGEFILFLDADDLLGEQLIKNQIEFLNDNPDISIAVCGNKLFSRISTTGKPEVIGRWKLYHNFLDLHLCYLNIAPPHAFMCRRHVINETGLFDTSLRACEDWDYWIRAASNGHVPSFNQSGIVYYRKHPESMSSNHLNQRIHDITIHNKIDRLLENNLLFPEKHRLESFLALSAGAIFTASRSYDLGTEEVNRLLELALKNLKTTIDIIESYKRPNRLLINFFCLKIIDNLNMININKQSLSLQVYSIVKEILKFFNTTPLPLSLMYQLLISILTRPKTYIWEFYETADLIIKTRLKYKNT